MLAEVRQLCFWKQGASGTFSADATHGDGITRRQMRIISNIAYVSNAAIGQCPVPAARFLPEIFRTFWPGGFLFRWAEISAAGTFIGPDAPWATGTGNGAVERVQ